MFPDKDLGCNSKTTANSRRHQQNTAAVRLLGIVGICKLNTLSLAKVADNISIYKQRERKEFAHLLMPALLPRSAIVGFVRRAIVASLVFDPTIILDRIERGISRLSVKNTLGWLSIEIAIGVQPDRDKIVRLPKNYAVRIPAEISPIFYFL
jgi:hypothetical protein